MNCYLFGDQSLTIECAETLLRHQHQVEGIVTADRAVAEWAERHNISVEDNRSDLESRLSKKPFDLLLSIAYLSIVPDQIVRLAKRAAINFHDGPLPEYAGLNVPVWALMNQERRHAVTWHLMSERIDAGRILLTRDFDISADETALSLNLKCYQAGIESFDELLSGLAEGHLNAREQDLGNRTYYAANRRPGGACRLPLGQDADSIAGFVRALDFGEYENPIGLPKLGIGPDMVLVRSAKVSDVVSTAPAGTIVSARDECLQVASSSRDVLLEAISTPEGRRVTPSSLIRKSNLKVGDRLPTSSGEFTMAISTLNREVCRREPYWVGRLSELAPPTIPYVRSLFSTLHDKSVGKTDVAIPAALAAPFAGVAEGVDLSDLLATAFAAYLSRICGQESIDLAFRSRELARRVEGTEDVFASHVPMRFSCRPFESIDGCTRGAVEGLQRARKNLTFARDIVLRYPQLKQLRGSGPCGGLRVVFEAVRSYEDHLPLEGNTLTLLFEEGSSKARWYFDESVLISDDVERMREQFEAFLVSMVDDPGRPIRELDILGPRQRRDLIVASNATATDYPKTTCIHRLVEAQAERTPAAIALVFEDEELTYEALNARANKLAHELRNRGLQPGGFVGIHLRRSVEMVVSVLATLKAGGAYLPLDPNLPENRIRFILEDSEASLVVTSSDLAERVQPYALTILCVDAEGDSIAHQSEGAPAVQTPASSLAYLMYTSGSTGRPKGVLVEHRNVANFFAGMDARIRHDPPGVWLAVTSLAFDISVLELLWTLARGFKVVVHSEDAERQVAPKRLVASAGETGENGGIDLSLFYFSSDESNHSGDKYTLLLEGAKFADANGLSAVWTPERHFHSFGGLYPNPSVTAAALAAVTDRVGIRAGSCVLPLHSPIRVAEEWALVDNLSRGRVGVSFASGWQPQDFVLRPECFDSRQSILFEQIEVVQRLWRGEKVLFKDGRGGDVDIATMPRPVQSELPVWITAAGNPETFRKAGEGGFNLLTHLLGQSLEDVRDKIAIYRKALAESAHQGHGHVTLMLHTFVGEDRDEVREVVREPMKAYLRSAVGLIRKAAWSFPTFKETASQDGGLSLDQLSDSETDTILDFAFERYFETSGLFGTPDECGALLDEVRGIGVDEVAALIDFGVPDKRVLRHLRYLKDLQPIVAEHRAPRPDDSIPALIDRHRVTHLQCTPSMVTMLLSDVRTKQALGELHQVMIGGEVFPVALARELTAHTKADVMNMYGPTETTIWSSVHSVGDEGSSVPIGKPIANTKIYVLDESRQPLPVGIVGELFIGGDGVTRGYHKRPDLTAERFIANPFQESSDERLYRTGDLVRYRGDGELEILGRADHQVKLRGYRIELGEVEAVLRRHVSIGECVVAVSEGIGGDRRLVAYLQLSKGAKPRQADLREFVAEQLPAYMIPSLYLCVDQFPLTHNKKIDRQALPIFQEVVRLDDGDEAVRTAPPRDELERTLHKIWTEVLQSPRVGLDDNFFDLGGHSLLAVRTNRLISQRLRRDVPLTDLFRFPTIQSLARHLGRANQESDSESSVVRSATRRIATRRAARSTLARKRSPA